MPIGQRIRDRGEANPVNEYSIEILKTVNHEYNNRPQTGPAKGRWFDELQI